MSFPAYRYLPDGRSSFVELLLKVELASAESYRRGHMEHEQTVTRAADDDSSSLTGTRLRSVVQAPRAKGHFLQPRWSNPGADYERINQIVPYVAGKSVLDVGCTSGASRDDWVHAGLVRVADRVVGVDINADAVSRVRQRGFDVRLADAESLLVPQEFDVVHAGELLEHLDNPRAFLAAARGEAEARRRTSADDAERIRHLELRLPARRKSAGERRPHVLVLRGHTAPVVGAERLRDRIDGLHAASSARSFYVHATCCQRVSPTTPRTAGVEYVARRREATSLKRQSFANSR